MSTAKELTIALGGGISLESERGVGTTVAFSVQVRGSQQELDQEQMKLSTIEFRNELTGLNLLQGLNEACEGSRRRVFHGTVIKKEVEALHNLALARLELSQPLKVLKFVDEVMEKALEKAKQTRPKKKSVERRGN